MQSGLMGMWFLLKKRKTVGKRYTKVIILLKDPYQSPFKDSSPDNLKNVKRNEKKKKFKILVNVLCWFFMHRHFCCRSCLTGNWYMGSQILELLLQEQIFSLVCVYRFRSKAEKISPTMFILENIHYFPCYSQNSLCHLHLSQ